LLEMPATQETESYDSMLGWDDQRLATPREGAASTAEISARTSTPLRAGRTISMPLAIRTLRDLRWRLSELSEDVADLFERRLETNSPMHRRTWPLDGHQLHLLSNGAADMTVAELLRIIITNRMTLETRYADMLSEEEREHIRNVRQRVSEPILMTPTRIAGEHTPSAHTAPQDVSQTQPLIPAQTARAMFEDRGASQQSPAESSQSTTFPSTPNVAFLRGQGIR